MFQFQYRLFKNAVGTVALVYDLVRRLVKQSLTGRSVTHPTGVDNGFAYHTQAIHSAKEMRLPEIDPDAEANVHEDGRKTMTMLAILLRKHAVTVLCSSDRKESCIRATVEIRVERKDAVTRELVQDAPTVAYDTGEVTAECCNELSEKLRRASLKHEFSGTSDVDGQDEGLVNWFFEEVCGELGGIQ
jgi:hypothetical protein